MQGGLSYLSAQYGLAADVSDKRLFTGILILLILEEHP
jgi:hypothetical protein